MRPFALSAVLFLVASACASPSDRVGTSVVSSSTTSNANGQIEPRPVPAEDFALAVSGFGDLCTPSPRTSDDTQTGLCDTTGLREEVERLSQEQLTAVGDEEWQGSEDESLRVLEDLMREAETTYPESTYPQSSYPESSYGDPMTSPTGDLPQDVGTLLVRTDFSHQARWEALLTVLDTPTEEGFLASFTTVEHVRWDNASVTDLVAAAPPWALLVLVDASTLTSPEMPVLVVHIRDGVAEELRVAADALYEVEINLSLGNMDWEDFSESADPDGVFRGFDW